LLKGILGEISLSSRGVKFFKTSGFFGKAILFAFAQLGSLPDIGFKWHVEHIHSVPSILLRPVVTHKLRISFEQDLYKSGLHLVNDDLYHNCSQHVQIYSGPTLMFFMKQCNTL
jgi:hypothetical protein